MRKKWLKKLGAAFCAAAIAISGMSLTAFAAGEKIEEFTDAEYQNLAGLTNGETTGTINVEKKISPVDASKVNEWKTQLPVKGAQMAVVKVGQYATVTETDGTVKTMIGIEEDLVTVVLPDKIGEMIHDDTSGYYYMPYDLYDDFQDAMKKAGNNLNNNVFVKNLIDGATKVNTDGSGIASFTNLSFGIYLVAENSVTTAQIDENKDGNWENVLFSKKQYPYIVSLPFSENNRWTTTVNAKAKNEESTVDVEKMIERNSNTLTGKREHQKKTDVTHVGDTVEFTLITDVPMIENHEGVQSYVITDEISAGYTLPGIFTDKDIIITDSLGQPYTFGTDYKVEQADVATESKYAKTVTITFEKTGRDNIEKLAHIDGGNQEVYVSYIVKVNEKAVVGTAGNPNRVKLDLAAAGSGNIETGWKHVTEYIFTMEGTKTFDGNPDADNAEHVRFKLYLDADCTKGVVLKSQGNGAYTYDGTATPGEATEIALNSTSTFSVKGVPVYNETTNTSDNVYQATLYLKETATAAGYNKLAKVIPITLTANTVVDDAYDGTLSTGTVNRVDATLNADNDGITFTVNNTSGFQLPSTGGMGIWMFVVGGILVIAFGIFYYRRSKKSA